MAELGSALDMTIEKNRESLTAVVILLFLWSQL